MGILSRNTSQESNGKDRLRRAAHDVSPASQDSGTSANPSLSYHAVLFPELVQKRFEDRVMFTPGIDLKQYRCRAVVDWIRLECRTSRTTQSVAVGRWFKEATGVQPHVNDPSKAHYLASFNDNGASFGVKIQTRNLRSLPTGLPRSGKRPGWRKTRGSSESRSRWTGFPKIDQTTDASK